MAVDIKEHDADSVQQLDVPPEVVQEISHEELMAYKSACESYYSNAYSTYYKRYSFAHGEQWDEEIKASRVRANRDVQTYNIVQGFIIPMVNTIKQAPPAIMVYPVSQEATKDDAQILAGVIRHIEMTSNAATTYTSALQQVGEGGMGAWKVVAKDVKHKMVRISDIPQQVGIDPLGRPIIQIVPTKEVVLQDDVNLAIEYIEDPRDVMWDPCSKLPDHSDARFCIHTYDISKDDYIGNYGGDDPSDSINSDSKIDVISITEYWCKTDAGTIDMYVFSSDKVLAYQQTELIIIPFVSINGPKVTLSDRTWYSCITENIEAPQKEINWLKSESITVISQAPKNQYIADEGALVDPDSWADAAINPDIVLYKKEGKSVTQVSAPPPPVGYMELVNTNIETARLNTGIYPDPSTQQRLSNASGKAIKYQQAQSQINTFQYVDALNYGIKRTGEILLDMISVYYNTDDIRMALGIDGSADRVSIGPNQIPDVKNVDLTYAQFGIQVSVGPSYPTQKEAYYDTLKDFAQANPALAPIILEAIMRNAPIPNAEMYADRAILLMPQPIQQMIASQAGGDPSAVVAKQQIQIQHLQQQLIQVSQALQQASQDLQQAQSGVALEAAKLQTKVQIANDDNLTEIAINDSKLQHDKEMAIAKGISDTNLENVKSMNRTSEHTERGNWKPLS